MAEVPIDEVAVMFHLNVERLDAINDEIVAFMIFSDRTTEDGGMNLPSSLEYIKQTYQGDELTYALFSFGKLLGDHGAHMKIPSMMKSFLGTSILDMAKRLSMKGTYAEMKDFLVDMRERRLKFEEHRRRQKEGEEILNKYL